VEHALTVVVGVDVTVIEGTASADPQRLPPRVQPETVLEIVIRNLRGTTCTMT
jgi:hypothetical protein